MNNKLILTTIIITANSIVPYVFVRWVKHYKGQSIVTEGEFGFWGSIIGSVVGAGLGTFGASAPRGDVAGAARVICGIWAV